MVPSILGFLVGIFVLPAATDTSAKSRVDANGITLPAGALQRYGDFRIRGGAVEAVSFSPDGKVLLMSRYGSSELIDVATGADVTPEFLKKQSGTRVDLLSNNYLFAAGAGNTRCWLAKNTTGEVIEECIKEGQSFYASSPTPDGLGLLVWWGEGSSYNCTAYDLTGPKPVSRSFRNGVWTGYAFSPDRKSVYAAIMNTFVVYDFATGKELDSANNTSATYSRLFVSPKGDRILQSSNQSQTFSAELKNGIPGEWTQLASMNVYLNAATFTSDGKKAIIPNTGELFDIKSGERSQPKSDHKRVGLTNWTMSPDGRFACDQFADRSMVVWEMATGKTIRKFQGLPDIYHFLLKDDKTLVTLDTELVSRVFDLETGKPLAVRDKRKNSKPNTLWGLLFDTDGTILEGNLQTGQTVLVDANTGKEKLKLEHKLVGPITSIDLRQDLKRALITINGQTELMNLTTGRPMRTLPERNASGHFTEDGKQIVMANTDHISFIETATNKVRQTLSLQVLRTTQNDEYEDFKVQRGGRVRNGGVAGSTVRFTDDNKTMAVFGADGLISIWNVDEGTVKQTDLYHTKRIGNISPDGRWLVSGVSDQSLLQLRDLTEANLNLAVIPILGVRSPTRSVRFTTDSKRFMTAHADGLLYQWDVSELVALSKVTKKAAEVSELWETLSVVDAKKAGKALAALLKSSDTTVPFVAKNLPPIAEVEPVKLQALISDLANADFKARELAEKELLNLRDLASEALAKALAKSDVPEQAERINKLLNQIETVESQPTRLRYFRAIELLERIGTSEAKAILDTLGKGAAASLITQEAKLAWTRLNSDR